MSPRPPRSIRTDTRCPYPTRFRSLEGGLQSVNCYACNFAGQLAYHDFEGVTVREEEGERLVENLGDKRILMLKNHGPVVMGKTLTEASIIYWAIGRASCRERVCQYVDISGVAVSLKKKKT